MSRARRVQRDIDGILLLDKPLGLSSNAALQRARELFRASKAGHAGSLDPLATGMLPVCFGQATKVCGRLLNSGKTYVVDVELGARTASGDGETEIIERAVTPEWTEAQVDDALSRFLGPQEQTPPMHSAVKFEGKRLYEFARRGVTVERAARRIMIHAIRRVSFTRDHLRFEVSCSKGTYVRTLASDIAASLGTLGYLRALRRSAVEPFGSQLMYTFEQLSAASSASLEGLLLPADIAFHDLPQVTLSPDAARAVLLGQTVRLTTRGPQGEARAYDEGGRFLGLVRSAGEDRVQPVRLFVGSIEAPRRIPPG